MKKGTIVILVLIIGFCFAGYKYLFHGHRDIAGEEAQYSVLANKLAEEFKTNEKVSTQKYLNKTIEISGKITSVEDSAVIVDNNISCGLKTPNKTLKANQEVKIKGRCTGYDDLFGQIKLDECSINN